jgi:hypothetical protein
MPSKELSALLAIRVNTQTTSACFRDAISRNQEKRTLFFASRRNGAAPLSGCFSVGLWHGRCGVMTLRDALKIMLAIIGILVVFLAVFGALSTPILNFATRG